MGKDTRDKGREAQVRPAGCRHWGRSGDQAAGAAVEAAAVRGRTKLRMRASARWWYATRRGRLLRPDVPRAQVRALRARSLSAPVFFALTVPIALFAPYVAEITWALVFPLTRLVFVLFLAEEHERPAELS
jgi:hypothetical protein